MPGPGEVDSSRQRLFERFDSVFDDPQFEATQSAVERDGISAIRRRGIAGGELEALRDLDVACYRYYDCQATNPMGLQYEVQCSREGRIVATLAFSAISSFEREEDTRLTELDQEAVRNSHAAVRYVLRHMRPVGDSRV